MTKRAAPGRDSFGRRGVDEVLSSALMPRRGSAANQHAGELLVGLQRVGATIVAGIEVGGVFTGLLIRRSLVRIQRGTAQFTTSSLEAGNHTVTARYGGDADHAMTASAALIHMVQAPPHLPRTTPRDEPGAPTAPVPPVKALRVTGVLATPYCLAPLRAKVKGAGRDITFSFALSDPARVTARVQRRLTPATRARRTCLLRPDGRRGRPVSFRDVVAPSRPVGKRRPFAQAFDAKAGSVRIRLLSLTRGARLTPGWYRLLLTAVRADGSAVAPVDVQFLVLRR
jgi:hypothetical protein